MTNKTIWPKTVPELTPEQKRISEHVPAAWANLVIGFTLRPN